jgi:hypothetical protein
MVHGLGGGYSAKGEDGGGGGEPLGPSSSFSPVVQTSSHPTLEVSAESNDGQLMAFMIEHHRSL